MKRPHDSILQRVIDHVLAGNPIIVRWNPDPLLPGTQLRTPRRVPGLTRSQRRKLLRYARAMRSCGHPDAAAVLYAAVGVSMPCTAPPLFRVVVAQAHSLVVMANLANDEIVRRVGELDAIIEGELSAIAAMEGGSP